MSMISPGYIVTGTDTEIGKTVFAAGLTQALNATYWKPIQSGLAEKTDTETVRHLAQLEPDRINPEAYRLSTPCSPHRAAEIDGIQIDVSAISKPTQENGRPLVVEGAGGLLVPLTRTDLQIDLFKRFDLPLILCARTTLGTINHTLLSLEAIRARNMKLAGIAFIGDENQDSEKTICAHGDAKHLGRLPHLKHLTPASLSAAFAANFPSLGMSGMTT